MTNKKVQELIYIHAHSYATTGVTQGQLDLNIRKNRKNLIERCKIVDRSRDLNRQVDRMIKRVVTFNRQIS